LDVRCRGTFIPTDNDSIVFSAFLVLIGFFLERLLQQLEHDARATVCQLTHPPFDQITLSRHQPLADIHIASKRPRWHTLGSPSGWWGSCQSCAHSTEHNLSEQKRTQMSCAMTTTQSPGRAKRAATLQPAAPFASRVVPMTTTMRSIKLVAKRVTMDRQHTPKGCRNARTVQRGELEQEAVATCASQGKLLRPLV